MPDDNYRLSYFDDIDRLIPNPHEFKKEYWQYGTGSTHLRHRSRTYSSSGRCRLYCASSNFRNYINGNTHNNYNYSFTAQIKQLLDSSWENLSKLSLRNIIGHMPKEL